MVNLSVIIALFVLLGVSLGAYGQDPEKELKTLLNSQTFILEKPLVTFNYQNENKGFKPSTLGEAINRDYPWADRFFDTNVKDGSEEGPGLYVSVDPFGSRVGFGGDSPQLYVITLKAGTRVLDLRSTELQRSPIVSNFDKNFNCFKARDDHQYLEIGYLRNSDNMQCRETFIKIIKELGVQAIMYEYGTSNSLENCRLTRTEALNVISSQAIDLKRFAFYSTNAEFETFEMAPLIKSLYAESSKDFTILINVSGGFSMPSTLNSASSISQEAYEKWKSEYVWKCGQIRNHEYAEGDDVLKFSREALTDKDLLKLELIASEALIKKEGPYVVGFSLNHLKIISKMRFEIYKKAGSPINFNQWQSAVDSISWANDSQLDQAAYYFGEQAHQLTGAGNVLQGVYDSFISSMLKENPKKLRKNIGILTAELQKREIPIRVEGALLEELLTKFGGAPFLTGDLPVDPNKDYTVQFQNDRKVAIQVLEKCIAVYNDSRLSKDDIKNGDCWPD